MTVKVYDSEGLNFVMKNTRALEIVKHILHSVGINYIVIDTTHAADECIADYIVLIDR